MESDNGHIALASAKIDNLFVPLDGTEWHEQAVALSLLFSDWFNSKLNLFFSLADLPPLVNRGEWRQRAQLSASNVNTRRVLEHSDDDPLLQNGALYEYGKMMAHSYLDEIRTRLDHLNVDITVDVAAGSPAHILAYKAHASENSLIVMQARPQVGWQRFVARKMSEDLLLTATVPVLMHSGDFHGYQDYRGYAPEVILLPMRAKSAMSAALPWALSIAQVANAQIRIVDGSDKDEMPSRARTELMESINSKVEELHIPIDVVKSHMAIDDAIVKASAGTPNPWVVLGSRMKRGITKRVMASHIDNIRRAVQCPLIGVPVQEILPHRETAIDRWLTEWRADRAAIESDQRWWSGRSMQRSVAGALTRIRKPESDQVQPPESLNNDEQDRAG